MIQLEDILSILREKNKEAIPNVIKAYKMAEYAHQGVYRESGEPYITHPLYVAQILLEWEIYDEATICAALLHDVVEDTDITLEDIEHYLNKTVAELVDGVTKIRRMNYLTREAHDYANIRKIITSLNRDVRIILIKLADRLHNMRTLQHKKPQKQRENAIETMEVFVPVSQSLGAYKIKSELEDLSLMYIEPTAYQEVLGKREELGKIERAYLQELKRKIEAILQEKNIPNDILIRTRNICTIYNKIQKGYEMENIYDLFYLKILVDEVNDCFKTLRYVHQLIPPINGRFKDYIYQPRTNHYQSLHTTGSDPNGRLRKTKIRTHDMDKVSALGIPAYCNINPNKSEEEIPLRKTLEEIQEEVRKNNPFAKRIHEIDTSFRDDDEFMVGIKHDLLTEHVYVYTQNGEIIELPAGSTALDFACQVYPYLLDSMTGIIINGKECPVNTILENNDTIQISTKGIIDREDWGDSVHTLKGKYIIKPLIRGQKHS